MGLLFKLGHSLTSRDKIERGGATLVGSGTTFGPDGMTLNGSGNVKLSNGPINPSARSYVAEFTPAFAKNDGAFHVLFAVDISAVAVSRTVIYKDNTNSIVVYSTTGIVTIAYATWQAYWNDLARNTLIVSFSSGSSQIYLNGTQIATSASVYTPKSVCNITLGADYDNSLRFVGTIHRFEIYGNVATAVDEPYLRQGTLISALNDPLAVLPGTSYYKNDAGLFVTDVGGRIGGTALMGSDGATAAQFPKVAREAGLVRGFSFDGGDQITIPDADALSFTTGSADLPFSIAMIVKGTVTGNWSIVYKGSGFGASDYGEYEIYCPSGGAVYVLLSDATLGGVIYSNAAAAIKTGIPHVLIVTYNGGGSAGLKIYRDGTLLSSSVGSSGVYTCMRNTSAPLVFGRGRIAYYLTGEQALQIIDNVEWSPMQVRALTARLRYQARRP